MERDRDGFFRKTGRIVLPFLVYYAGYLLSSFVLYRCWQMVTKTAVAEGMFGGGSLNEVQQYTVTGIVNGISMLIGAAFLLPMLQEELHRHKEEQAGRHAAAAQKGRMKGARGIMILLLTVVSAISSSIGLNILLSLTGLVQNSAGYQQTVQRQYGVAFGIGLFLYTVVSPFAEEVVFRGVIYNRLRQSFCGAGNGGGLFGGRAPAILLSGLLFGIYHGNMVQGVYGCCMGVLISYLYERTHAFYIPCLFHAAANCVVYLTAQHAAVQEKIFTVPCCVMLLMVTFLTIYLIKRLSKLAVCQKF